MESRKSKIKRDREIIFNRSLITSEKFIKDKTFNFTLLNNVNYIKNLFNNEENTRDNFHNYKEVYRDIIKNIIKPSKSNLNAGTKLLKNRDVQL